MEKKWNGGPVRRPDDQIPTPDGKSSAARGMASVQCATFAFAPDLELGPDGRWSRSQRTGSGTSALLRRVSLCIRPIRHHLNVCRLRHAPCATVRAVENKRLTVRTRWGVVRDAGDTRPARQSGQPDRWVGGVRGGPGGWDISQSVVSSRSVHFHRWTLERRLSRSSCYRLGRLVVRRC